MKKIILSIILLLSCLNAENINVAVAANVSYAIDDLLNEFHKRHPNINVQITLGSSGKLTAQIKNGAPYDIFISANMKYPNALYKEALAITKPIIYAQGSLAIFSAKRRDFSQAIKIVTDKSIKRIAIANPHTAPYGKAALEALKNAKLYKKVKAKFIYAESISQTVAYAVTAADLGFVAKSSLYSPNMRKYKEKINYIDIKPELYTPIKQGIVILKKAANNQQVKAFYDFILSKKAKKIFINYGYLVK